MRPKPVEQPVINQTGFDLLSMLSWIAVISLVFFSIGEETGQLVVELFGLLDQNVKNAAAAIRSFKIGLIEIGA